MAMDPLLFQTAHVVTNYLYTDPSSRHFRFLADYLFTRRKRGLPSRCAFVLLQEVALSTEDDDC